MDSELGKVSIIVEPGMSKAENDKLDKELEEKIALVTPKDEPPPKPAK